VDTDGTEVYREERCAGLTQCLVVDREVLPGD
jgi:hypothetical protein